MKRFQSHVYKKIQWLLPNHEKKKNCIKFYGLVYYGWHMSPHHIFSLHAKGNISHPATSFFVSNLCWLKIVTLNFAGVLLLKSAEFSMTSMEIKGRPRLLYRNIFSKMKHFLWSLYVVLLKFYSFYGQFEHNYNQACICDGIVYNFTHIRNVFMVESVLITKYQVKWHRCTVIPNGWYR